MLQKALPTLFCLFILSLTSQSSFACPKIDKLIDYNCDEKLKITFTGDSFVKGVRDVSASNEGYVGRLREAFPDAEINNLGVAGITSTLLLRSFKNLLSDSADGETKQKSKDADAFFIEVGPNDYWQKENPALTVRNIRRLVKLLKQKIGADVGTTPVFAIATLLPTKRGYQRAFINSVNKLLLSQSSSSFPVRIRFDAIDKNLLSFDGLHPSPAGYDKMASIVKAFITEDLQTTMKVLDKDEDLDGVYDRFETTRFGTDPTKKDTDGDGVDDGQEIFYFRTDPLTFTTVFPTPTPTPTVTPTPTIGTP